MATEIKSQRKQTFRFNAPEAQTVLLAGDFTKWQEAAIPMQRRHGGPWSATVELPPGEHHYRFIVDGNWCDDPQCTLRAANPYGSQDMVARVS